MSDAYLPESVMELRPPVHLDFVVEDIHNRIRRESQNVALRWRRLKHEVRKLQHNKAMLAEEWARHRVDRAAFEAEKKHFEELKKMDWSTTKHPKTVRLNLSGQVFETTQAVLKKDEGSMLAALCGKNSPLADDPEGTVFIERDWWLFRYVLQYLRMGGGSFGEREREEEEV